MIVKTASKTNTFHPCIVVYADGHASTYLLVRRLRESFGNAVNVRTVTANDVLNEHIPKNTVRFILPGTPKGSSSYRDQLGQQGFSLIRKWIEHGMDYEGHCAGAYLGMSEFAYYYPETGELREMAADLALAEGIGYGPIFNYIQRAQRIGPHSGYALAKIDFTNAAGQPDVAGIMYSSGPILKLFADAKGDYDVLARFKDIPKNPIAALRRNDLGLGTATLISFPPEMGSISVKETPATTDPFRIEQLGEKFFDVFQPWNDSRERFWNDVVIAPIVANLQKEQERHFHAQPA